MLMMSNLSHSNLVFVSFLVLASTILSYGEEDSSYFPNSCASVAGNDGDIVKLKFLEGNEFPVISAKCSNNYAILDYSVDPNIASYFTSWHNWYKDRYGPRIDDLSSWDQWFLPSNMEREGSDQDLSFVVSPDCDVCTEDNDVNSGFGRKSSYYMSANIFGCFWAHKGFIGLDEGWDDNICYHPESEAAAVPMNIQRDEDRSSIDDYSGDASTYARDTGVCSHSVRKSSTLPPQTHDDCSDPSRYNGKPSLGTDGKYCVCVKPSFRESYYYENNEVLSSNKKKEEESVSENEKYVELFSSNFKYGTYRITEPGYYKIMEDIEFDFKNPHDTGKTGPNAPGAYWPEIDDLDMNGNGYPGAGDYMGTYAQGYFAGISVESDDVTIDLNSNELRMSNEFYYQQRWFTVIELSGQYFLPGEGTFWAGPTPKFSENIVIKDGTLGLTSHHGIHGNNNKNILVENVHIKQFETHGIQLNGFEGVELKNLEIGPSSHKAYLNGQYAHGRTMLNRFRKLAEADIYDTEFQFYGRDESVTMRDISIELEKQMDYALNYVLYEREVGSEDEEEYKSFKNALTTFVLSSGDPNGASIYGIFLNTHGASLFTYNLYTEFISSNAKLSNIKIHGIVHRMSEATLLVNKEFLLTPLSMAISFESIFKDDISEFGDGYLLEYTDENILTDALIVAEKLTNTYEYLGQQFTGFVSDLALNGNGESMLQFDTKLKLFYNGDIMFHIGKGIQALRIDGVDNVELKNIEIYDNKDQTPQSNKEDLMNSIMSSHEDTDSTVEEGDASAEDVHIMTSEWTLYYKDEKSGELKSFNTEIFVGLHNFGNTPMTDRFEGNNNIGINLNAATNVKIQDVYINNLQSQTGAVFGISVWPAVDVTFANTIEINNLQAGVTVGGQYNYLSQPNRSPEVCGIRDYGSYMEYSSNIEYDTESTQFKSTCLQGHVGCLGESSTHMFLGADEVGNCDDSSSISSSFSKIVTSFMSVDSGLSLSSGYISIVILLFIIGGIVGIVHIYRNTQKNRCYSDYEAIL